MCVASNRATLCLLTPLLACLLCVGCWIGVKILVPLICEDGGLSYCVM